ncbi:MAG: rhamnogalacturonan acetylesterase [Bacteroidaceae bacterium]|nr:rhamnogalacturonan acetylesterase [Bacteroidaceae bacterium]MBR1801571.1 rhamnogalacturonan acetylesterase [Bacteroidaceae bacterium]
MEDVNKVVDLTLDSLEKVKTARPVAGSSRVGDHPVLFLVGNSTMRTGTKGNGDNGQWGWGFFAHHYFDANRITVENQALGGTSSRTFYRQLWPDVKAGIRPGDYVIIELGHNDNGPFDSGRCRATIRGISSTDSLVVTLKEGPHKGETETVYSYGEYLRRFVRETRALGAHPILMSLTPRKKEQPTPSQGRGEQTSGRQAGKNSSPQGGAGGGLSWQPVRVADNFGGWARQVAEELNVPFIDLNELSASKYDQMSSWKLNYHFYLDNIHTSKFGAELNARSAAEGLAACQHSELKPLQAMMVNLAQPTTGVKREKGKPVVFITGDSTVKNTDRDSTGMWGWGSQAARIFDADKITWINCAQAGRSLRTYLREGRWEKVYNDLQAGDYVLIQFGHNDIGELHRGKHRGDIPGVADTSCVSRVVLKDEAYNEVVYSFGWYLRKMIDDCRQKGATPIIVSLTPRNEWQDGRIERRNDTYGQWYRAVAEETGCDFVDLHNITADALDGIGQDATRAYYNNDHTHTSLYGAQLNAIGIAIGLRRIGSPLAKYLK